MTVACQKDDTYATPNTNPTPNVALDSLTISIDGKTYTHTNLNAAFFYNEGDDGFNINFAPENIGKIIDEAVANNEDLSDLDAILASKTSVLFDIDIPGSTLGETHTLSPKFDGSTANWNFYISYMNKAEEVSFSSYHETFKSGTMRIDLDKETGKLTINIDAVITIDESDATIKITFEGTAYHSPEYMWSL
ncbi:MAG: hypothetical protein KBT04_03235 [Bacteroidales bacterium]|nr:hypothetical protein [Candidatus Colimorpha onthohippi]